MAGKFATIVPNGCWNVRPKNFYENRLIEGGNHFREGWTMGETSMHLKIGSNLSMKLAREREDAKAMAWAILDRVNHGDDMGLSKDEFHDTVTWALRQTGDL